MAISCQPQSSIAFYQDRGRATNHRVLPGRLSEELCKEWGTRLDKAFSGGIPRQHLIWMWNLSDIPGDKRAGLLTLKELDEFVRQAEPAYCPTDEGAMLELIGLMNKSTAKASNAIDNALESIEASNKRIAEMEKKGV